MIDIAKIKLIIWDLDDTFWRGTLSEGGIEAIQSNVELIDILNANGVVNSICSKNDFDAAESALTDLGVNDAFVFKSIDWTPKGPRISTLLKDMGLRAENVLFIDDNPVNLNEALHYEPKLMTALPEVIPSIISYFKDSAPKDPERKRLKQYRVLEKKQNSRKEFSDNESFLYASETSVELHTDCLEHIDRLHDLVIRSNQLNYTKLRPGKEEFEVFLREDGVSSCYATVSDRYGDYGIVGFAAMKEGRLIHFLFSCRTIGQGVEQYVYAKLGYPELTVNGPVINMVDRSPAPGWINTTATHSRKAKRKDIGKIIFKGPCDLQGMTAYLDTDSTINELTYISPTRHNNLEHQGCMVNYIQIPDLSDDDKQYLVDECIFNDKGVYETEIFDKDVDLIFISSLQECHFGIYRHKTRPIKLAFGEWNHPMTEPTEWVGYIDNKVWTSGNRFTKEFLEKFAEEWEFIGRQTPDEYMANLRRFMTMISPKAHVCIFLGSELPTSKIQSEAWIDRHLVHKEINDRLRTFAGEEKRLHLIDYNDFVHSEKDYTDSIDHFQRVVQYNVAVDANKLIADLLGNQLKQSGRTKIYKQQLRDVLTAVHLHLLRLKKIIRR